MHHPLPSNLGVQNEVTPIEMLDLKFVPLFLIEHPVIVFNPKSPNSVANGGGPKF